MDLKKSYRELLKKREWARQKLDRARKALGHPHLDFMSAHDLAETEFGVWSSYLEDIEKQLTEIEKQFKKKK